MPDGILTEEIFPIYESLARGGVGLIITGHMYVDQDRKCGAKQTGIANDAHLPGLRRLAQVSRENETKVVAQINYTARHPNEMSRAEIRNAAGAFVAFDAASYISGQTISCWPTAARRKEGSPCPSGSLSL